MYTEMTCGTLFLHQITPVIRCLFGAYELDVDENVNAGQEVWFYDSEERGLVQWPDVTRNMLELAATLGLQESCTSEKAQEHSCANSVLRMLDRHFNADSFSRTAHYRALLDNESLEYEPELRDLFEIAAHWNDGHGLQAMTCTMIWCSDGQTDAQSIFVSERMQCEMHSCNTIHLAQELDAALIAQDLNHAVTHLRQYIDSMTRGIGNSAMREDLLKQLGHQLLASVQ
jgi:hypothetical protein